MWDMEEVGKALFLARQSSGPGNIDLRCIQSMEEARTVQDFAVGIHGGVPIGYTLAATSAFTARRLNCFEPVVGRLLEQYVQPPGKTVRLPYGTLGCGAQFIFLMGAPVREPLDLTSVAASILSCRMGFQVLGRRTAPGVPLNDWSATADFGLDAACVIGAEIDGWEETRLDQIEVSLRIDGSEVAKGGGAQVLGDPVSAVLHLARSLRTRDIHLQAGDMIATGSCTGLSQVVPGQRVQAVFGGRCDLEVSIA